MFHQFQFFPEDFCALDIISTDCKLSFSLTLYFILVFGRSFANLFLRFLLLSCGGLSYSDMPGLLLEHLLRCFAVVLFQHCSRCGCFLVLHPRYSKYLKLGGIVCWFVIGDSISAHFLVLLLWVF